MDGKWVPAAALVGVLGIAMIGSCDPGDSDPPANGYSPAPIAGAAPAPSAVSPAPYVSSQPIYGVNKRQVQVTRVIDGDTFEILGGDRVRLLGVDACEATTPGGATATTRATDSLFAALNQPITITEEPGIDRDNAGRLLRYVQMSGTDLGIFMVMYDDVGIYSGRNDASGPYLTELRESDTTGRACGSEPGRSNPTQQKVDDDDQRRPYIPAPRRIETPEPRTTEPDTDRPAKPRSGGSGHPCTVGERDGDGDGFCGES